MSIKSVLRDLIEYQTKTDRAALLHAAIQEYKIAISYCVNMCLPSNESFYQVCINLHENGKLTNEHHIEVLMLKMHDKQEV